MREARKGRERLELKGWGCAYAGHIPYKRLRTRGWERVREAGKGRERLELRGWDCAYAGLGEGGRGWN